MADVLIRPTQPGDAAVLAANLRDQDRAECEAYGREDIAAGIELAVRRSSLCWTALVDGELACVFGCTPLSLLGGIGSPWMLGTPVVAQHQRILVQETPRYIAQMKAAFPHLANLVHAKNTKSVRWLRRLGFTIHPAIPYGPLAEPFHPFEMRD